MSFSQARFVCWNAECGFSGESMTVPCSSIQAQNGVDGLGLQNGLSFQRGRHGRPLSQRRLVDVRHQTETLGAAPRMRLSQVRIFTSGQGVLNAHWWKRTNHLCPVCFSASISWCRLLGEFACKNKTQRIIGILEFLSLAALASEAAFLSHIALSVVVIVIVTVVGSTRPPYRVPKCTTHLSIKCCTKPLPCHCNAMLLLT